MRRKRWLCVKNKGIVKKLPRPRQRACPMKKYELVPSMAGFTLAIPGESVGSRQAHCRPGHSKATLYLIRF